jgi:hypothetical protein
VITAARLILNLEHCVRETQRQENSTAVQHLRDNVYQQLDLARKELLAHIEAKDEEIAALRLMSDYDND